MDDVSDNNALFEAIPQEPMMEDAPEITEMCAVSTSPGTNDAYTGQFTWEIVNFSKLPGPKVYSDKFEIGTHCWRLLIFPRGNKSDCLSVYLEAPEAAFTPLHLSPKASFKLVLVNKLNPQRNFTKDTQHTFTSNETDWGFTPFFSLKELWDPEGGWLVDDTLTLRVEIQVQNDRDVYDSRKETGCVGLKNQGATCYMNSLLQYLFHLPYFRKAVYHMPTPENEEPSKSLPLALQSLFFKLQYGRAAASTKDLTKSFGWGTMDAFMQHDVQELNRVLCEKLEEKMKGTKVEKVINELFEGHTCNYITCINVDCRSTRTESFMDLQLDVKGCRDVYDSFNRYTEEEVLDGQNQYKSEEHGLQDARKGVKFQDLPPVLQLQLKRFEYDFHSEKMVKINDRYEFLEELDLDREERRYFSSDADVSVRNLYRLHSVLVHSGGVHGGHYYAFIRPDGQQWLKFDDERVTLEAANKALDDQFGGEDESPTPAPGFPAAPPPFKFAKFSNAYMLVYIRVSDWDRINCEVTKDSLAEHLRKRLEAEQVEKEKRQKEKAEAHLFCHLKVARDKDLYEQIGHSRYFDLVDFDKVRCYRLNKLTKFSDFKKQIAEETGIPPDQQRYWSMYQRQNLTLRPCKPLPVSKEGCCLMDLREFRDAANAAHKNVLMDLKLFLETPVPPDTSLVPLSERDTDPLLIFVKLYDPLAATLRYVGRIMLPRALRVRDIKPRVAQLAGLPPDTEITLSEEIKFDPTVMCEPLNEEQTLAEAQLEHGDIMCVQRALSAQEAAECPRPDVKSFLQYIRNRKHVHFKPLEEPSSSSLCLELSHHMTYDEVTAKLAEALGVADPSRLRLTQHNAYSHAPQRNPVKFRSASKLESLLSHGNHVNDTLYYELLDMPLPELEQLKTLKVSYHNSKTEFVSEHALRLPRTSTVAALLEALAKELGDEVAGAPMRLMEVYNSRIYKVCAPDDTIEGIDAAYWSLRAEVVPGEEVALGAAERVIPVYHFRTDKDNSTHITNFGDPFFLKLHADETVGAVRTRIKDKLKVPDEEFSKWRCAFISIRAQPEYLADEEVVAPRFSKGLTAASSESNYLGLEHHDKAPRRPQPSRYNFERPVKIYN